jgi:hypothetical protein
MANILRIKRRAVGGAAGPPATLKSAEIAFNEADNTLYYGKGDSGGNATSILAIAGDAKAPIASPIFTGNPQAPTPTTGDNDTSIATTAFVRASVSNDYVPDCGRLERVSNTTVVFLPYNGDKVKIQGVIYSIGSGVYSDNTNCYLNSVAGQNLVAGTTYLVAIFHVGSGVLALDFLTNLGHGPDTTAGNLGVETSSTNRSRTVVGIVYCTTAAAFTGSPAMQTVISWFNRKNLALLGASTGGVSTTSGSPVEITAAARAYFLTWVGENLIAAVSGSILSGGVGSAGAYVGYDGTAMGAITNVTIGNASWWGPVTAVAAFGATDGILHYITPMGTGNGVVMNFHVQATGIVRG